MDKVCHLKKPNSENNAFAESLNLVLSRELFRTGLFDKSWAARQSISDGSPLYRCFFCRLKADVFTSRDQCQRSKCKVSFLINVLRVYMDKSFFLDFANLSYIFKSTKQFWTRRIQRYPIFSGFVPSTVAASERVSRHPRLSKQDDDRKNHERNYYCGFKDNRRRAISSCFFDLLSHIRSYDPRQLQQQHLPSEMT